MSTSHDEGLRAALGLFVQGLRSFYGWSDFEARSYLRQLLITKDDPPRLTEDGTRSRERLFGVIDEIRAERDAIYSMTVIPRRFTHRALKALDEGRGDEVRFNVEEAKRCLDDLAEQYDRWMSV